MGTKMGNSRKNWNYSYHCEEEIENDNGEFAVKQSSVINFKHFAGKCKCMKKSTHLKKTQCFFIYWVRKQN